MIKQFDLERQLKTLHPEISKELGKIFETGQFCLGQKVEQFENSFAEYLGTKYAVGVNSGSAALILALEALGIGLGDEVIVPVNTYIATAFAVSHVGATPVFVDHDCYYNIEIEEIQKHLTSKTKAIIVVHLYGQPAAIMEIKELVQDKHIFIVEDCAQAVGAEIAGKKVGTFGDIGCFSFYPTKNLGGAGDGGMVVTDDQLLNERIRQLRDDGRIAKYEHARIGYNERLDAIQAAFLNIKLPRLNQYNKARQRIAAIYNSEIEKLGLPIILPHTYPGRTHVYHQYVIQVPQRDRIRKILWSQYQIGTGIHYPIPIHKQEAYTEYNSTFCPIAEDSAGHLLSLPMFPELTEDEAKKVVTTLGKVLKKIL